MLAIACPHMSLCAISRCASVRAGPRLRRALRALRELFERGCRKRHSESCGQRLAATALGRCKKRPASAVTAASSHRRRLARAAAAAPALQQPAQHALSSRTRQRATDAEVSCGSRRRWQPTAASAWQWSMAVVMVVAAYRHGGRLHGASASQVDASRRYLRQGRGRERGQAARVWGTGLGSVGVAAVVRCTHACQCLYRLIVCIRA